MSVSDIRSRLRRAFESAKLSPALSRWITAPLPIENDIRWGLSALRARSRDAAQNDDHAKQFFRLVETNVIGSVGISVTPRVAGAEPSEINDRIKAAYDWQSRRGAWDVTGQLSRNAFSRLSVRSTAMDGEMLIRIHEDAERFAVEAIDAESLDLDYNMRLQNGNEIRMGVEFNELRKPVAYHLFEEPPPQQGYTRASLSRQRVPAEELLHVFLPEWIWQSRGIPWTSTALIRLKMLTGYEEAAITAARAAAIKSAIYTQDIEAAPGTSPPGEQDYGSIAQDLAPGQAEMLPPGWDVKTLDWHWPNTDHGEFVKECLRAISGGLGVSYNALANDLESVNYSSLRQGALAERDFWMSLQAWFIEWVEQPIYTRWLQWAIVNGIVTGPSAAGLDAATMPLLGRARFAGRRWPWVDPLKDQQAAQLAVKMRTRSISDVIREQGRDPEEVWDELKSDLDRLEELDLMPDDILQLAGNQNAET